MMKKCIIFDNEDQTEEIEKLIRDGRNKGVEIECEQFNVGSTELTEVLTNGEIDISKVVAEFRNRYGSNTFHLAVFDWNLDDENVDGIELIRQLTHYKILKKTPKIVISGLLTTILNDIVKSEENRVEKLLTLINNDIRGYFDRTKYEQDIIRFFERNEETLDLILEEELQKFPSHIFENRFVNKNFNRKTFIEIVEFLEDHDQIRNDFKKEMIHQVMAYLTEKI